MKFGVFKGADAMGNKYYEVRGEQGVLWCAVLGYAACPCSFLPASLVCLSCSLSCSLWQDLDLPYGQHRWVEYKDIHNFDASMVQPA